MSNVSVDFFLPVYNEEKILKENVQKLLNFCREQNFPFIWRIVITVNGSTDRTLERASWLVNENQGEVMLKNYQKAGKGFSLKKAWLDSKADIVSYMDIDLAVSLFNIKDLLWPIISGECDLVIGSRLLAASRIERSFFRELSSQTYNLLSRLILRHCFSDMQCGFKAIKTGAFKKIEPYLKDKKWFFDTELIIWTKKFGYKIKEVPVDWSENRYEKRKSKVRVFQDSFWFFVNLIKLKIRLSLYN